MHFVIPFGISKGRYSNKENRVQKLYEMWNEIQEKMIKLISRGHGKTGTARCAYGVLLMMKTGIRIGNESSAEGYICNNKYLPEYGKTIQTYGLTTLPKSSVTIKKNTIHLSFIGKKGVFQELSCSHPVLSRFYSRILSNPANTFLDIDYHMLKSFVKKRIGKNFMPKDIRTVVVNRLFSKNIQKYSTPFDPPLSTKREVKKFISETIQETAEQIGHTKGVCKSAYISKSYLSAVMTELYQQVQENKK